MTGVLALPDVNPKHLSGVDEISLRQYSGPPVNLWQRWLFYEEVEDPYDFNKFSFLGLGLAGHETLVDAGCGDGRQLVDLRTKPEYGGFMGKIIGLDIDESAFIAAREKIMKEGIEPIDFVVGSMQKLQLASNSVDKVNWGFSIFQAEKPMAALREGVRVMQPDGRFAITTNGAGNIPKHKVLHQRIAKHPDITKYFENLQSNAEGAGSRGPVDIQRPITFSSRFNLERVQALSKWFKVVAEAEQVTRFVIHRDDADEEKERKIGVILTSLESKRTIFRKRIPGTDKFELVSIPGRVWAGPAREVVTNMVHHDIKTKGAFVEPVHRGGKVFENQRPS